MIDWISVRLPFDWKKSINDGRYVVYSRNGTTKLDVDLRLSVKGAYDGSITVRTIENKHGKFLEISGNPLKFSQGHNLFGTNNLRMLVPVLAIHLCKSQGMTPSDADLKKWMAGDWTISRIDLTEMLALGSRAQVRNVLRVLRDSAVMQRRGRGHWRDGTIYFGLADKGKRALPWMLKFYCKADELELNEIPTNPDDYDNAKQRAWGGKLDRYIQNRDMLCQFADDKLRIELTLRTKELQKLDLYTGDNWSEATALNILRSYLGRLEISTPDCEAVEDNASLPLSLRRTFAEWKRGIDVRANLNRQTLFRHRKQILEVLGVDIATEPSSNIPTIPIRRMLVDAFRPEPTPSWAARMVTVLNLDDYE